MITLRQCGWLNLMKWTKVFLVVFVYFPKRIELVSTSFLNTGTAIFKVAKTEHELPAQGSWLTLDVDGEEEIPRDWYLRLCGHAQKMMLKKADLTATMPIKPSDYCFDCQDSIVADH